MSDVREPVSLTLARHAVETRRAPLPEPASAAARRAFVDWAGATIGGSEELPASALTAGLIPPPGPCRIVGTGASTDPTTAALINGTAAHTLEVDDIYSPGLFHPGAPVIAAALAAADREHVTGALLLRGILIGYEVGNRVAADLGPSHYVHWHTTGTAGAVAAAASVAEILRSDEERFAHALTLAASMAAGLQQTFRSDAMGKPLHAGHAAQAGTVAALAAHGGLTGAPDVLEGEVGMGTAMGGAPGWTRSREPFGPVFLVEHTTVKPYPCCGHTFAPIDGALNLRADGLRAEDAASIEVHTYGTALDVAGIPAPRTPAEARFSIPFAVASALRDGTVAMETFTEGSLRDPELQDLAKRVELHTDPGFQQAFPARRGARVDIIDHNGSRHSSTVPDRSGSPENPLSDNDIEEKFLLLAARVKGAEWATRSLAEINLLPHTEDVRTLLL